MYQGKSKTRLQAEKIANDRYQMLMNNYPKPSELKGLSDGEVYARLERCFGKEYVERVLDISAIETQIKSRVRRFFIGMSFVVVGALVWTGFQANTVINAISKGVMDNSILFPAIATVIVIIGIAIYIWRNIKAFKSGSWNIKMDKGR